MDAARTTDGAAVYVMPIREEARRILHAPRESGTVGGWRVGDVIETQEQADLLQGILEGRLVVTDQVEGV